MTNSADPNQLASSEANCSGSTMFAKTWHVMSSKRRVNRSNESRHANFIVFIKMLLIHLLAHLYVVQKELL